MQAVVPRTDGHEHCPQNDGVMKGAVLWTFINCLLHMRNGEQALQWCFNQLYLHHIASLGLMYFSGYTFTHTYTLLCFKPSCFGFILIFVISIKQARSVVSVLFLEVICWCDFLLRFFVVVVVGEFYLWIVKQKALFLSS